MSSPREDEAEEGFDENEDGDGDSEPEDGEDLLGDDMYRDYEPQPELDRYSASGIDDAQDVEPLSVDARMAAERDIELRQRRRLRQEQEQGLTRKRFRAEHLLASASSSESGPPSSPVAAGSPPSARREKEASASPTPMRRRRGSAEGEEEPMDASSEGLPSHIEPDTAMAFDESAGNITEVRGPVSEWVVKDWVRLGIRARFLFFLRSKRDAQGNAVYRAAITAMVNAGRQSLVVSFTHLTEMFDSILAIWVSDAPAEMLAIFDDVATEQTLAEYPMFPSVSRSSRVHVRVSDLPVCDPIREIRQVHLNALIKVAGVVTRRSMVFPQLQNVVFDCLVCGYSVGPVAQRGEKEVTPLSCPQCQKKSFRINYASTVFRNYQTVTLQEAPGQVPPGRLPRSLEITLLNDLIDTAKPGFCCAPALVLFAFRNAFERTPSRSPTNKCTPRM